MQNKILFSFLALKKYCEEEDFKGWDPYDGLNSKVIQSFPFLYRSAMFRLAVIQAFKRSPFSFRSFMLVPSA